jgi:hypothetical protein
MGHLGLWPGANTFDEIDATYPTDAALKTYIASGMGSSVARPEITGNDARDLIYWIRFNTIRGATDNGGNAVVPGPDDPDTGNYPTFLTFSAVRATATSINVTFTTDKPCIGYAMAGSSNQVGLTPPYCVFSPIENFTVPYSGNAGGGLSHSMTIPNCPSGAAMYVAGVAKDMAGNSVHTNAFLVP